MGLLMKNVPVPFCCTISSEPLGPTCPPSSVPLFAPRNCSAPLEIVSTLPTAPMFTVCAPPAGLNVSEFTERAVMPLLHSSGLTMPAVV